MTFKLKNRNFVKSSNFALNSDVVYSEVISNSEIGKLGNLDIYVMDKNNFYTFYKLKKFKVKSGDVIFCNSLMLECLFYDLKKLKNISNLIVISSQSDRLIDKKILKKKPKCVEFVYSINIDYVNKNTKPLPIGLANNYSPKNLLSDQIGEKCDRSFTKDFKLYLNFNENTNFRHRGKLKPFFEEFEWTIVRKNQISLGDYKNDLQKYQFILCPWGNGIDTHRIWEALYLGSIPVVMEHKTFSNLINLPIIFVKNYREISYDFLKKKLIEVKNNYKDDDFLNVDYWVESIKSQSIHKKRNLPLTESTVVSSFFYYKLFSFKRKINSIIKRKLKLLLFRYTQLKRLFYKI